VRAAQNIGLAFDEAGTISGGVLVLPENNGIPAGIPLYRQPMYG
jgi:hypothetical protein